MEPRDFPVKQIVQKTREVLSREANVSMELRECVDQLCACVEILHEAVIKLDDKVKKNSRNSHKPPSTNNPWDRPKDKPSKNGGGRLGGIKTLKKVSNPDEVITHRLNGICDCGASLNRIEVLEKKSRQVFEIILKKKVTEHRVEYGECYCGKKHQASWPLGVTNHTQYGPMARSLVSYLSQYQLIPFERLEEIFNDLFDLSLCEGTIYNANNWGYQKLEGFEALLKDAIKNSKVAHADETPIKVGKGLNYLHTLSTKDFTFLLSNKSRGKIAVEEMDVLSDYQGIMVHDCYSMYFGYGKHHAICNAHLLRELTFMEEEYKMRWAHEMRIFLKDLNDLTKDEKLRRKEMVEIEKEYKRLILRAERECPDVDNRMGERTPPGNLLFRLRKYAIEVLRFAHESEVPFTNNQAERDLRMVKIHQKISGHFRSQLGSRIYARWRSYLSTLKKRKLNTWVWINHVFESGQPQYLPIFT